MTVHDETMQPQVLEEPGGGAQEGDESVWMRGLYMLILAILFRFGQFVLGVATIIQFLWMLFGKEKNQPIAEFGLDLSDWLARVARFQTAVTDEKPFPFARWGRE